MLPKEEENPKGLHQKYQIRRITGYTDTTSMFAGEPRERVRTKAVDKHAEYFVLRLDLNEGSDRNHVIACRYAIHAYAATIQDHLPELAKELRERYPLINPPNL